MAQDPYKYFRIEAKDLIEQIGQGILEFERNSSDAGTIAGLLRFAHTLKGAARVVRKVDIAERAHAFEELLVRHREAGSPPGVKDVRGHLRLVNEIAAIVRTLGAPPAPNVADPPRPEPQEPLATVRLDVEEMDLLLRGVSEASVRLAALERNLTTFERIGTWASLLAELLAPRSAENGAPSVSALAKARTLAHDLYTDLERLRRELATGVTGVSTEIAAVREAAHQLRLLPARAMFPVLERAVYDAAQALDKRIEYQASGGDVRLDAHVLSALGAALLHVVRNAVAHGIEPAAERLRIGKAEAGSVALNVFRRGGRAVFRCQDDGRGVDFDKVRRAAEAQGLASAGALSQMSSDELVRLLLGSGLSTSAKVTEMAGRGIGLDVVRETAARLKGSVRIESEAQRGTVIEIEVPVSLASLSALVVEAGGARCAIPLDAVRATRRLTEGEVARSQERDSIIQDGRAIPFFELARGLRRPSPSHADGKSWPAVVVGVEQRSAAFGVDRVVGVSTVVVHALPSLMIVNPIVAGATLDAEGIPELVLDPLALVLAAENQTSLGRVAQPPALAKILVVDDSLTTRMLEQSILESAGYTVELAISAEDALEKARAERYGLFIVDVEMPGMDGFEFVARTRADPQLSSTPAILVTSRDAPEDRSRGQRAGARAYIVKGEFDQGTLLTAIRELLG